VLITSQNHGFAADEATLPATLRATHRSAVRPRCRAIHRTDRPRSASRVTRRRPGAARREPAVLEYFVELMLARRGA